MKKTLILALILMFSAITFYGCGSESDDDWVYYHYDGAGNISYSGESEVLNIPTEIDGYEITIINSIKVYDSHKYKVVIPETVNNIGFGNWFKDYEVAEGNEKYCSEDGVIYSKDKKTLYYVPNGKSDYSIPECVSTIDYHAFFGWSGSELFIPSTVKRIPTFSNDNLTIYLDDSFKDNTELIDSLVRNDNDSIITVVCNGETFAAEQYKENGTNFDTSKLIEIDPHNLTVPEFVNNFNVLVPGIFADDITEIGLKPDDLKLTSVRTKTSTDINVFGYVFCGDMFFLQIGADPATEVIESVTIGFNAESNELEDSIRQAILADSTLTCDLIIASYAVFDTIISRDDLFEKGVLVYNYGEISEDSFVIAHNYEENGIKYNFQEGIQSFAFTGSGVSIK